MDEGTRGFDHLAIANDLVNECFLMGGRGVEAIMVDFPGERFGGSVIVVQKMFAPGHYNDKIILMEIKKILQIWATALTFSFHLTINLFIPHIPIYIKY